MEIETGLRPQFKWPNDLLLEGRKLGGILVEARTLGDRVTFVIIGIGLNVNQPQELVPLGGISLRTASGFNCDLRGLLNSILKQARSRYEHLNEPQKIMSEWWDNCIHRSRKVQVDHARGVITGISKGVDLQGNLLVETQNKKTETVPEGSLRVLEG